MYSDLSLQENNEKKPIINNLSLLKFFVISNYFYHFQSVTVKLYLNELGFKISSYRNLP